MATSSSAAVLDTVELLEMILYTLPTKDLLFAQRVSKQWKFVIESSTKLQQALFMVPIQVNDGPLVILRTTSKTEVDCRTQNGRLFEGCKFFKNPLTQPILYLMGRYRDRDTFIEAVPRSWQYPAATWRKMLWMQPPVAAIAIYHVSFWGKITRESCDTGKVLIGELTDWVEKTDRSSQKGPSSAYYNLLLILEQGSRRELAVDKLEPLRDGGQLEGLKVKLGSIGD